MGGARGHYPEDWCHVIYGRVIDFVRYFCDYICIVLLLCYRVVF